MLFFRILRVEYYFVRATYTLAKKQFTECSLSIVWSISQ
jgi:hypothetical protein